MQRHAQDHHERADAKEAGDRPAGLSVLNPIVLFVWLAATAWLRPLSLPDEGRYVGVAWEMLRSSDWLVPTLDSLPYFHKPPLFYWLTAAGLASFGTHEWAARLPSLLASTGAAFALYLFLRRWADGGTARLALLVLATTPFFFAGAQFANLDMLVAACITCTILCAAEAVLSATNDQPRRAALAGAYAFGALGVLAKGLIGVVLPAIVIGAWLVITARPLMVLRLMWSPGLALFAIIAVPWFALMQARYPDFSTYFFIHHHVERYVTTAFNGQRPFWFYIPAFAALTLPWCTFLPWALRRSGLGSMRAEVHALMWTWLAATLVFFSVPSSKLIGYVLPATPPLSALVAHALVRLAGTRLASRRHIAINAIGAAGLGLALVLGYAIRDRGGIDYLAKEIRPRMAPGDRLVAIGNYPFSLPFYLRYPQPIAVVLDWDADEVRGKDSWRKELYDAARFAPERGTTLLLRPPELAPALCAGRVWVFGRPHDVERFPVLGALELVAQNEEHVVWLARTPMAGCVLRE